MTERTVLILANGDWNALPRLRAASDTANFTIAADGAWAKAHAQGIPVDRVVGDLDSLRPNERAELEASGTPVDRFPADKDWTDLELAIAEALALPASRIVVFGAFGGRTDHTLAAVFLMERSLAAGVPIQLLRGEETLYLVEDVLELSEASNGDRVSILPVTESACVSTHGLRFPLERDVLFRSASRGVSNETVTAPPRIQIHEGRALVLHAPFDWETSE